MRLAGKPRFGSPGPGRVEPERGRGHLDAVEIAAETSGHPVVVSGFAVTISMAGLLLAGDAVFSSLAVGSILVVLVAVIGSLTVLPALLAKLGRWIDWPRALGRHRSRTPRIWPAVLRPALRHPRVTLAVGGFVVESVDYAAHVRHKLPLVMGFVLVLTFFVMAWVFRSVVVALTSIAPNMLSAAAAYGLPACSRSSVRSARST